MSTVGCSSFSPATIVSSGRLTGKRCRALSPDENVLLSAAEMCVGLDAATTRDDAWDSGKGRVSCSSPESGSGRSTRSSRPRVPAVDVDASRAGRAAGGDDLELAQQMVPGAAIEVRLRTGVGRGACRSRPRRSCPSGRSWSSPADRRWRDQTATETSMPSSRRPCHDDRSTAVVEQGAKRDRTLLLEASERPIDAGDVVGNQPLDGRHMGVPERLRRVVRTSAIIHQPGSPPPCAFEYPAPASPTQCRASSAVVLEVTPDR